MVISRVQLEYVATMQVYYSLNYLYAFLKDNCTIIGHFIKTTNKGIL